MTYPFDRCEPDTRQDEPGDLDIATALAYATAERCDEAQSADTDRDRAASVRQALHSARALVAELEALQEPTR
jgi:hypothetical protein